MSFFAGLVVGCLCGWLYAHHVVSSECDKIGGFYVGDKIYHCTKVEKP